MMEFIINFLPWFWLSILIVCVIVEAFTMALTTVWGAIAAIPMIFIARTSLAFKWQFLIYVILTAILVIFTRPLAVKFLRSSKNTDKNVNALDGQEVLCVKKISKFKKGEVKAKNGVVWSAESEDDTEIEESTNCVVSRVEGNTLIVKTLNVSE